MRRHGLFSGAVIALGVFTVVLSASRSDAQVTTGASPTASWKKINTTNEPSPRAAHAMAYDAANQKVVVFGGYDSTGAYLNETWTFDGKTWTQENPTSSPPPRAAGAMA